MKLKRFLPVLLVFVLQFAGASLFLFNILSSLLGLPFWPMSWQVYEMVEILTATGLVVGVLVSGGILWRALKARDEAEENLRIASSAFSELVAERFAQWRLSPAERDVALFAIKGLSTADVASLRNTSEGTVKAQTNAIYRKAGVTGRGQLQALFLEDLMDGDIDDRIAAKKAASRSEGTVKQPSVARYRAALFPKRAGASRPRTLLARSPRQPLAKTAQRTGTTDRPEPNP